jgi:hypothetical protein
MDTTREPIAEEGSGDAAPDFAGEYVRGLSDNMLMHRITVARQRPAARERAETARLCALFRASMNANLAYADAIELHAAAKAGGYSTTVIAAAAEGVSVAEAGAVAADAAFEEAGKAVIRRALAALERQARRAAREAERARIIAEIANDPEPEHA